MSREPNRVLAGSVPQEVGRADYFSSPRCCCAARDWHVRLDALVWGPLGGQVLRMLPNEMGCLTGVEARDQAAIELQVSFVLLLRLYSAHQCINVLQGPIQSDRLKP